MREMKPSTVATVIGDVVDSRLHPDRIGLHRRLTDVLAEANRRSRPVEPLAITVGDEWQGCFESVGEALAAAALVRNALWADVDVRFGFGWGEVTVLDAERGTQDGPGWWAARAAIQAVTAAQAGAATRKVRSAYRLGEGAHGPAEPAIEAALRCRDHLVGSLDERSRRILKGLMDGQPQAALAAAERISPSAVSQRVRSEGLAVLTDVERLLGEVR